MSFTRVALDLENGLGSPRSRKPHSFAPLCETAWEAGIRAFVTADGLADGEADRALGAFLKGKAAGDRFVAAGISQDPLLKKLLWEVTPSEMGPAVERAVDAQLERMDLDSADLIYLRHPGKAGYRSEPLWKALAAAKAEGKAKAVGIAPGPSNGYALDLLLALDRFGEVIDWASIVYHVLEPWPGEHVLAAAQAAGVRLIARESAPAPGPAMGWHLAERGGKLEQLGQIAQRHGLSGPELISAWALREDGVEMVMPRFFPGGKPVDDQLREYGLVATAETVPVLDAAMLEEASEAGDNRGKTPLKGGTQQFQGPEQPEQWPADETLHQVAERHELVLDRDYFCKEDPRDLRDFGMPVGGVPQATDDRLFMQLQVFTGITDREAVVHACQIARLEGVVYADLNDPRGVGVLLWDRDPLALSSKASAAFGLEPFEEGELRPEFTMLGRTYGFGREDDVNYWLTRRPIEAATFPNRPWAVWYPLRRSGAFYRLPKDEQADMLREHGIIGHNFGSAGYAADIRLECFGMDPSDNEFVLGLLSPRLDWLSKLVKKMRDTRQTGEFMDSLGPFFVGHTLYQGAGAGTP